MNPRAILKLDADLSKLSKACNAGRCRRLPSKQATIIEVCGSGRRELVDLYFCDKHFAKSITKAMKALSRSCEKGKTLSKEVYDIGYVTY